MHAAVQFFHAFDRDGVGTRTTNIGPHGDEELSEVDHLRLTRGVFQHRGAFGQRGCHQQVLGAGDGDRVQNDTRTTQATGLRADEAILDTDVCAHLAQPFDVDIDRACTNGAATGQRHIGTAEASQQRPEHQNAGAHGLHQLIRRHTIAQRGGVHPNPQLFIDGDADAHAAQQFVGGRHVLKMGNVAHCHLS